ncbi:MAG: phosphoribosylamine--glycine ligase [Deltaproteobacteria bacterium RIFCSPLOWO2_02_FULL_50_16]|nr:MAG: phosphoribosylamine--glycine ligase [Deltaproteobacteria bacterium GWA2_50_8]OGQ26632.1 MAG: phosphoribosylamine--glycine ligase [Deltaproteobacteria bacterium RIFCSPHIGHO2_02_FULL_50_15]OGQ57748.1 MAG: phosphoribosylamine--glycine ligase [Deltaproteobacteria bacterium RIFCSPLOWO2_02_FULL_50_16]OGQ68791.1 MAG: phosphoribosylamine--glycine ligase [Deltaproteobacteria bacterium RIFCSPLOWO2_12_FULL_50_11]
MKVLLVGGGGREHALAWKIAQSPKVTKLFCAPGNAGISQVAECVPIAAEAVHELLQFAKDQKIDLTVVGPEQPLVIGIVDTFRQQGLRIFGPTQGAARLEGSKVFTKRFLEKYRIPTASYGIFDTYEAALSSIQKDNFPLVMKADGLAAGKGVLICQDFGEGKEALEVFFRKRAFGAAGKRIVIEEFLKGEEVSYIAFSDGEHFLPLASSKDHKRIFDNDQGLNTGGMGAFSPTPAFTPDLEKRVIETVIRPTIQGMKDEGTPFEGILYVGLMLTKEGPKVLEFNVRMGDPETQPLLVRMKTDIIEIIEKVFTRRLHEQVVEWEAKTSLCIVMASGGYPGKYEKGHVIEGLDGIQQDVFVFHAGTEWGIGDKKGKIVTNGGRVLGVTALGDDLEEARKKGYKAVSQIHWPHVHYRRDIGRSQSNEKG